MIKSLYNSNLKLMLNIAPKAQHILLETDVESLKKTFTIRHNILQVRDFKCFLKPLLELNCGILLLVLVVNGNEV